MLISAKSDQMLTKNIFLQVQLVLQLKMELIRSQLVLETYILSADSNCQVFLVCSHIHIKLSLITYPNVTQLQNVKLPSTCKLT